MQTLPIISSHHWNPCKSPWDLHVLPGVAAKRNGQWRHHSPRSPDQRQQSLPVPQPYQGPDSWDMLGNVGKCWEHVKGSAIQTDSCSMLLLGCVPGATWCDIFFSCLPMAIYGPMELLWHPWPRTAWINLMIILMEPWSLSPWWHTETWLQSTHSPRPRKTISNIFKQHRMFCKDV